MQRKDSCRRVTGAVLEIEAGCHKYCRASESSWGRWCRREIRARNRDVAAQHAVKRSRISAVGSPIAMCGNSVVRFVLPPIDQQEIAAKSPVGLA